jgi:Domain of unknown function (DUF4251)
MILRQNFLLKVLLLVLVVSCYGWKVDAQSPNPSDKQIMIKNLVESQNYVFVAQTAIPMTGRARNLSSQYDLTVTSGSIVSRLPFYGRSDTPPIDPSKSPLEFSSKNFDYKATAKKKGSWEINIKPKDNQDVQNLFLTISADGYASLQVSSNTRESISFNGSIISPAQQK